MKTKPYIAAVLQNGHRHSFLENLDLKFTIRAAKDMAKRIWTRTGKLRPGRIYSEAKDVVVFQGRKIVFSVKGTV